MRRRRLFQHLRGGGGVGGGEGRLNTMELRIGVRFLNLCKGSSNYVLRCVVSQVQGSVLATFYCTFACLKWFWRKPRVGILAREKHAFTGDFFSDLQLREAELAQSTLKIFEQLLVAWRCYGVCKWALKDSQGIHRKPHQQGEFVS